MEEHYERGEVSKQYLSMKFILTAADEPLDANKIIYIVNQESNPKEKDTNSNVYPDQKHEQEDDDADEALPIHHSEVNSTSLMLSSVEHMGMAAPSRPMNMGDDRN
jgi:hypothetical protein